MNHYILYYEVTTNSVLFEANDGRFRPKNNAGSSSLFIMYNIKRKLKKFAN